MMNKWISYIDEALKQRKNQNEKTTCFITDLVRGKAMFKSVKDIRKAVDVVVDICKREDY